MKALRVILAGVLFVIAAGNASAHSFPAKETPSAGETLSASPAEVAIKFDAPIEHLFAQLQVLDADGRDQAISTPDIDAGGVTLSIKLPVLKSGHYTVKWAVVCIDTHHTNGSYDFIVAGAGS